MNDDWRDGYDFGVKLGRASMLWWLVFAFITGVGAGFTVGYQW